MNSILITTDRLNIRKFNLSDAEFIFNLLNSTAWLKYIGDRNIKNLEDAKNYLANGPFYSYNKFGFGPYLVELKDTGEAIGMCSLIKRDPLEYVDLGFAFLDQHINMGYAYEASKATLDYAMNLLKLKHIVAITLESNAPSIKLLQKLGLRFEKTIRFPDDPEELLLFTNKPIV